jgi:hypothetical protein
MLHNNTRVEARACFDVVRPDMEPGPLGELPSPKTNSLKTKKQKSS